MAINTRQSNLIVAENWKKIYQTFREADFTSYDFENLRKSMIDYLRINYPEDFNDFIESSEYIALIDLIAFMGQSLAFRADLNTRENFIDTAERRDSILKLARLVSYNPKRNIPASGLLKIETVSTTESVTDSNGLNLSNLLVGWNDNTNDNWLEQFTVILNAAIVDTQSVGKPANSGFVNNILTEEYTLNIISQALNVFRFQSTVENSRLDFEIVSATTSNQNYIYEKEPSNTGNFNILYRNDNLGNNSNNSGFFLFFKQGTLANQDFNVVESVPNRSVSLDVDNINETDLWLYNLDNNKNISTLWKQVPAVSGVNVIYSREEERNVYQINSRAGDQVDLVFGDGSFSNMAFGNYRVYYRTSAGLDFRITPDEMQGVLISIPYVSRSGRLETLTFRASLKYTVSNASARETLDEIRQKAPQQYYTQNRMITGEDYNVLPYTSFNNVVKAKSINRTSSGLSRFFDLMDNTGKYSSTNVFGNDGILRKEQRIKSSNFVVTSPAEIYDYINQTVINEILGANEMLHFYYENFPVYTLEGFSWNHSTTQSRNITGYFVRNGQPAPISGSTRTDAKYLRKGAIIKFVPPEGYVFDATGNLVPEQYAAVDSRQYIYSSVTEVFGNGTNDGLGNYDDGSGPVTLGQFVPTGAVIDQVFPFFKNTFTDFFRDSIIANLRSYETFGITYFIDKQVWRIIKEENLSDNEEFSLVNQADTSGQKLDRSWLVQFINQGANNYLVKFRSVEYIFESVAETSFYFDELVKVYDSKSAQTINDQIKILGSNLGPAAQAPIGNDLVWYIYRKFIKPDGLTDTGKIYLTFADSDNDGIPDDPELFEKIIGSTLVFYRIINGALMPVDKKEIVAQYPSADEINRFQSLYKVGQKFFSTQEKTFYILTADRNLSDLEDYRWFAGRQSLNFQYRHNSPDNNRIDPSTTNVVDVYMLTSAYENRYRQWIQDSTDTIVEPDAPTTFELETEFSSLNNLKSISDTIIFNSAKFKPLFGAKAAPELRAKFKVIKNSSMSVSDNEIKTLVINAVNNYFSIENWEFGETFYFSELSAYLHRALSPNIASVLLVPEDSSLEFGNLYQINAEPYEILISAATVDDVEIIDTLTANQLNMNKILS